MGCREQSQEWKCADFRDGSMLSKKSKIELQRKSREGQFLIASAAADLCRTGAKIRGRFCTNRRGPSRYNASDTPTGPETVGPRWQKTFSTASVKNGLPANFRFWREAVVC